MELNRFIDHTLLKPDATAEQFEQLCQEAIQYKFYSVCVPGSFAAQCFGLLKGSDVKVCTVAGFPLGSSHTSAKLAEAEQAFRDGAGEIDMVMHIGHLKAGKYGLVKEDIKALGDLCRQAKGVLKVIIETGLLSEEEKRTACRIAEEGGAHFVKTCTGFAAGQATVSDVKLMLQSVCPAVRVKASGGIRGFSAAMALLQAGAQRLGTSASVKIIEGRIT